MSQFVVLAFPRTASTPGAIGFAYRPVVHEAVANSGRVAMRLPPETPVYEPVSGDDESFEVWFDSHASDNIVDELVSELSTNFSGLAFVYGTFDVDSSDIPELTHDLHELRRTLQQQSDGVIEWDAAWIEHGERAS